MAVTPLYVYPPSNDLEKISVSSNVTLSNNAVHLVSTAAARSLTLPAAASGLRMFIKDVTGNCLANNITIVRAASEKIENVAASYTLNSDYGSWELWCDGTDWWVL